MFVDGKIQGAELGYIVLTGFRARGSGIAVIHAPSMANNSSH